MMVKLSGQWLVWLSIASDKDILIEADTVKHRKEQGVRVSECAAKLEAIRAELRSRGKELLT